MYQYRSKCRWNMLLHIDGEVVEIRPSELFESKKLVDSRYLELINKVTQKKKKGRPLKKAPKPQTFIEETHGSSSGT
jgi:hypothetical protein